MFRDLKEFISIIGLWLFITGAVVAIMTWPVVYFSTLSGVKAYPVLKQTIEESRGKDIADVERATLTKEIVENNITLKKLQYWNTTIIEFYIPDEIDELEPLK